MSHEVLDGLDETWRSLRALAAQIPDDIADRPTRLPGWSVRDNYSHLIATLLLLLGRPERFPPSATDPPHIRSAVGRKAEPSVAGRRHRPARQVLDEFCAVSLEASVWLRARAAPADLAADFSPGVPLGEMLSIVLMDNWIHEQDIRVAAGTPGHVRGPAVEHSRDRMLRKIAQRLLTVLDPRAGTVAVHVRAPAERRVTLSGGEVSAAEAGAAHVELEVDAVVLAALAGGRVGRPEDAGALGVLEVRGDVALTRVVLDHLSVTS